MQRQRDELVPIGNAISSLDDAPVPAIRDASPQARRGFTLADQVHQLGLGQRSGPRKRLHGADDGAVLPAPHQPRQPPSEYKRQSTAPSRSRDESPAADNKLPFRQSSAPFAVGLGLQPKR